jgi:hypothetical protein
LCRKIWQPWSVDGRCPGIRCRTVKQKRVLASNPSSFLSEYIFLTDAFISLYKPREKFPLNHRTIKNTHDFVVGFEPGSSSGAIYCATPARARMQIVGFSILHIYNKSPIPWPDSITRPMCSQAETIPLDPIARASLCFRLFSFHSSAEPLTYPV